MKQPSATPTTTKSFVLYTDSASRPVPVRFGSSLQRGSYWKIRSLPYLFQVLQAYKSRNEIWIVTFFPTGNPPGRFLLLAGKEFYRAPQPPTEPVNLRPTVRALAFVGQQTVGRTAATWFQAVEIEVQEQEAPTATLCPPNPVILPPQPIAGAVFTLRLSAPGWLNISVSFLPVSGSAVATQSSPQIVYSSNSIIEITATLSIVPPPGDGTYRLIMAAGNCTYSTDFVVLG